MRYDRLILVAACTALAACATHRPQPVATAACPLRPETAELEAELRRVAQDTARTHELERLLADTTKFAELRRTVEDRGTTAELQRLLADTSRIATARPQIAELERGLARLSACWRE